MLVDAAPLPFLRWAGSKRWLTPRLTQLIPSDFRDYYEPFLGSGALYFAAAEGHRSFLADLIDPLIDCFTAVKDHPEDVADAARRWATDKTSFYAVRELHPSDRIESAARFIYLNKLCFNGLYRENRLGEFNVPYGRPKSSNVVDTAHLKRVSARLSLDTSILASDFEESLSNCKEADFVYLDPPYVDNDRFVDYNSKIFTTDDQERLRVCFEKLDRSGVFCILSLPDCNQFRQQFSRYWIMTESRYSSMSSRSQTRGKTGELLILSSSLRRRLAL
ncbi:DNA adenine methylase [Williamsia maris]|uniref:Site-specific DNA-methyltransferase (adenine-specific) n=1 Tax=Williamsia maris TaxID=72806 RepID=A0ABT1HIX2_9NOCA|nr:Dam family site-specific DNA-(adenine-N6)-methyltransferase [Williamsia maris]MCP2177877.1 DNA adenine methylase [Williamsia maris]